MGLNVAANQLYAIGVHRPRWPVRGMSARNAATERHKQRKPETEAVVVCWTTSDDEVWPGIDPLGVLLGVFALVRRVLAPAGRLPLGGGKLLREERSLVAVSGSQAWHQRHV